jgi:hypothetical protein
MILRFSVSFVFLFSVFELFSQGDYRPGFIVSLEKDTIPGFILYKENDSRFSICSFRKEPDAESTAYTPLKIIGYGFQNDSYYVSREITINFEKHIFFAEILVSGRSTLLKVTKDFYLEDSENSIYELAKVITEVTNDKGRFLKTNDVYKGILNWKFADCPEVARKTPFLKFEEAALTRIFEQYNACSGQVQKSFKSVKPWSEISIENNT